MAAYAAGLFDGEGYVGIDSVCISSGKRKIAHLGLRVVISQKDGAIMDWLKENFGGNVYRQRNADKYYIHRWRIHSTKALDFLKFILPYSIIKKQQIGFAISFHETKKSRKEGKRENGRFIKLDDEELMWRISQKEKLSLLKTEYKPYTKG